MKRGIPVLVGTALLALLLAGGGCQAIVSGEVPAFTCTPWGTGACPAGQYCKGAGCVACEAQDVCDGFDNDCDGKADNGDLADRDHDGYPSCGRLDPGTGQFVDFDCDDTDPKVHPHAPEVCDGRDDDCDGRDDNLQQVCGAGRTCTPAGQCIDTGTACTPNPNSCPAPKVCDPATLQCVDTNVEIGGRCAGDASCRSGLHCGDAVSMGSAITDQTGGSVCTKPCCTSNDCPSDFICSAAGTGGRYCVAKALVGRARLGQAGPGTSCGRDDECRSGSCSTQGKCVDTCCASGDCSDGTTCALTTFGGHRVFACVPPIGSTAAYSACQDGQQCRDGVCADVLSGFGSPRCVPQCCGATGCGSVSTAVGSLPLACSHARVPSGEIVAVCATPTVARGARRAGESCRTEVDCQSSQCIDRVCVENCCVDTDCPQPGWTCRPKAVNFSDGSSAKVLRCQRP